MWERTSALVDATTTGPSILRGRDSYHPRPQLDILLTCHLARKEAEPISYKRELLHLLHVQPDSRLQRGVGHQCRTCRMLFPPRSLPGP